MTPDDIISALDLEPLPWEGGWYTETYRATTDVPTNMLGSLYGGEIRQLSTAIFYLLTVDSISKMHRVTSDEIFHFYLGDPVEQLRLHTNGSSEIVVLGPDIMKGQLVQAVVPGGVWQGARLMDGGTFALMGTTVAPGFSFDDFVLADGDDLRTKFPDQAAVIARMS